MMLIVPTSSNTTAANTTRPAPLTWYSLLFGGHPLRGRPRCPARDSWPSRPLLPCAISGSSAYGPQPIAVPLDHDSDQPLLREGALGTRVRRSPIHGARPSAADSLGRGSSSRWRQDRAGARLWGSGAGGFGRDRRFGGCARPVRPPALSRGSGGGRGGTRAGARLRFPTRPPRAPVDLQRT